MSQPLIDLVHISKRFDDTLVLDDLCLSVKENSFVTLLGPSGCGKTTTLRIIGGFESPDQGKVIFGGEDITKLPPNKRQLNTVFQKYALFPHMSIADNIAFGLKIKNKSKASIDDKIKYALKLVNLNGFEDRSIDSLSGGQQQRIAIARAIVNEPKVLLLDEPLGALDLKLRQDMQYELIRLKNELGITFIYVTHDQEEALTMSDTIVVMNQGYIQQMGTPEQIYNEPENAFVADFIGESNIVDGIMLQDELVEIFGARFACVDKGFRRNQPVDVVIRPEDIDLVKPEDGTLQGVVTHLIFKGVHYEMEVTVNGFELLVHSTDLFPVGQEVGIHVDPFDIQIMNKPESEDEEAAAIDGCTPIKTFWRVMFPLAQPGIITVSIFNFLNVWNEYFMSLVFASTDAKRSVGVGLFTIISAMKQNGDYGALFAAVMIVFLPTFLLYLFLSEKIIAGVTGGGVKG